ncbi:MAG: alpha/beta hydrolase, partial [Streptomyces sp.]|nr:alpha/beta hydrolase [Streptomyces sp.]
MAAIPVPFDPALNAVLEGMPRADGPPPSLETIPLMRAAGAAMPMPSVAEVIGTREIDTEERRIPGPEGAPDLEITV